MNPVHTIAAIVAAIALAATHLWVYRLGGSAERTAHAETRTTIAQDQRRVAELNTQAIADARAEEARRADEMERIAREAQELLDRSRADAADAGAAAERLRRQLAAFTSAARATPTDPGAPASGQAAGDPIGVLADVLERVDRRAGVLAEFADRAHAAGLACERAYDALTTASALGSGSP